MRIKKVCQHCGDVFTAQTTTTKYCSLQCAQRAYKKRVNENKIDEAANKTRADLLVQHQPSGNNTTTGVMKELVNIKELSVVTSLSERTLFRLIKDKKFPKMKVGKRLVFNKDVVVNYLNFKYGSV
jgi:predicted DNA-binding transcriptional regulator AlpA